MIKLRQLIFPVLLCFTPAVLSQTNTLEESLRQAVLEGGDTSGFSVSVYFPSDRYNTLSGSRDPATKSPITENTAFRIASITKT